VRAINIETLRNKLREYVRLAAAGEVVLVTDRDRIVAELRAPGADRAEQAPDALLADILAALDDARRDR
jgi:antitoxin (DNA-binding transcriptional repressor) of toxin-antitoxin stability system